MVGPVEVEDDSIVRVIVVAVGVLARQRVRRKRGRVDDLHSDGQRTRAHDQLARLIMKRRSQFERELKQAVTDEKRGRNAGRTIARVAIPHVRTCFTSDPDQYDVLTAVVFLNPKSRAFEVFEFAWDDGQKMLWMDDSRCVVRDVVSVHDEEEARLIAVAWVGDAPREVGFKFIPGIYQSAFVHVLAGYEPPSCVLAWNWVLPSEHDILPVRLFPAGMGGELNPPVGEVRFVAMRRDEVETIWRLRGW